MAARSISAAERAGGASAFGAAGEVADDAAGTGTVVATGSVADAASGAGANVNAGAAADGDTTTDAGTDAAVGTDVTSASVVATAAGPVPADTVAGAGVARGASGAGAVGNGADGDRADGCGPTRPAGDHAFIDDVEAISATQAGGGVDGKAPSSGKRGLLSLSATSLEGDETGGGEDGLAADRAACCASAFAFMDSIALRSSVSAVAVKALG
jgi:hypothetical protein